MEDLSALDLHGPNTAGQRAIMIGIALGVVAMAMRLIMGVEKGQGGGRENETVHRRIIARLETLDRRWIYLVLAVAVSGALLSGLSISGQAQRRGPARIRAHRGAAPGAPDPALAGLFPELGPRTRTHGRGPDAPRASDGASDLLHLAVADRQQHDRPGGVADLRDGIPGRPGGTRLGPTGFSGRRRDAHQLPARFPDGPLRTGHGRHAPLRNCPPCADVQGLGDFGLIVSLSAGLPGLKEWILYAGDVLDVPIAGGCTGVGAPQFFPYYPLQLVGLMGALKGAAEYEAALKDGYPGRRCRPCSGPRGAWDRRRWRTW